MIPSGTTIPRILIIDDLFGRTHPDRRNEERANLCGQYLLEDVTGDETDKGSTQRIKKPVAQAVFYRGQQPACATVGDVVENDLEGTLRVIREGWDRRPKGTPRWAMILLDLCFYTGRVTEASQRKQGLGMPEGRLGDDDPKRYFGLDILEAVHEQFPDLPVVILSSKSRDEVSRAFSYQGALGFLPRGEAQSPELLQEYLWRHGLIVDEQGQVVGRSKPLLLALRAARRATLDRRHVLIRGERGTGKELLARYLHRQAQDGKAHPFIVVNSSVLSPDLFASELFGIQKRVATGVDQRAGLVAEADDGDLFLDEIKDMHPQVQAGILRMLEGREITSVGATTSQPVDVRVLSATNADIEAQAAAGSFRDDLLDRLREGGTIVLPPLRDRKEDLPLLVEWFVREAEEKNKAALRRAIDSEALDKLLAYDWPGNIRELRTCIFNAVNNYPDVEHLVPVHIQFAESRPAATPGDGQMQQPGPMPQPVPVPGKKVSASHGPVQLTASDPDTLRDSLTDLQAVLAAYLEAALEATRDPLSGEPKATTAYKLLTEKSRWGSNPTTRAYDLFNRLLNIAPEVVEDLLDQYPLLRQVYEQAEGRRGNR